MKSWAFSASSRKESALPQYGPAAAAPLSDSLAIPSLLPRGLSARLAPALTPAAAARSRPLDGQFARTQVGGHHLGVLEHGCGWARGDHPAQMQAHELVGDGRHQGDVV